MLSLDVHPTEKALVVNYEMEATILGQLGDPMLGDKKECQKIIRLKSLDAKTDVATVAKEVLDKCKIIHQSKLTEVQHLISYLKGRKRPDAKGDAMVRSTNSDFTSSSSSLSTSLTGSLTGSLGKEDLHGTAYFAEIDSYQELLYEDLPSKIKGTALLLQLARNPDYLQELSLNEALLGALARLLREDWKKSLDLSYNIVYVFFCFSAFTNFHSFISHFKIGSLCMDILDGELQRADQLREQLASRRRSKSGSAGGQQGEVAAGGEEGAGQPDKTHAKYQSVLDKQDQVLRVCTYLLLNIAEDPKVEEKMRRKNIVGLLVRMLERRSPHLLLLLLSFLKKLSVYTENKDDMCDLNVVEKVSRLLPHSDPHLTDVALRLLLNLSFDAALRQAMIRCGLLPKLVPMIENEQHQQAALSILYHLSVDDKSKSLFTYTDAIAILMKLILSHGGSHVPLEVMALAVNLAGNKRHAQRICEQDGLKLLLRRAVKNRDPLLMKMIRNIAQHEGPTRELFKPHVEALCQVVSGPVTDEFVLECVGVLGCLALPHLDYTSILTNFGLLQWIQDKLQPGCSSADDLILEVVVLLGTLAGDECAAAVLLQHGVLNTLVTLINDKQEDDELVLQILYVFYQLCRHPDTRGDVIATQEVPAYLIDLMHDNNTEIRRVCDTTLDIIAEHSQVWASKIQQHKFRWHNSQWLDMVDSSSGGIAGGEGASCFGGSGAGEELLLLGGAGEGGLAASFLHHSDVLASQHSLFSDGLSSPDSEEFLPAALGASDARGSANHRYSGEFE